MCVHIYVSMVYAAVIYVHQCVQVCVQVEVRGRLWVPPRYAFELESLIEPGAVLYPVSPSDPPVSAPRSICAPDACAATPSFF